MAKKSKRQRVIIKQNQIVAQGKPASSPFQNGKEFDIVEHIMKARGIVDPVAKEVFRKTFLDELANELDAKCAKSLGIEKAVEAGLITLALNPDGSHNICSRITSLRSYEDLCNLIEEPQLRKMFYLSCVIDCLVEVIEMLCQHELLLCSSTKFNLGRDHVKFCGSLKRRCQDVRNTIHKRMALKQEFAEDRYGEAALDDSDWLKDVILLAIDRVGCEPEIRVPMIKRAIKRMKSGMNGMYDFFFDTDRYV